eukprot:m.81384 g.81384  ORF g.81384 m.81384 type:complete len:461 (+) comp12810_c0_seq3:24-1406(+)
MASACHVVFLVFALAGVPSLIALDNTCIAGEHVPGLCFSSFQMSGRCGFESGYLNQPCGWYSSAHGYGNVASGNYSFATGQLSKSSGELSIAMGRSVASGHYSISMGEGEATGPHSIAVGNKAISTGYSSIALGRYAEARSHHSIAMGPLSTAYNEEVAIAIGHQANSSGWCAISMGHMTKAEGKNSVAIGNVVTATGSYSFTLGSDNHASKDFSGALGHHLVAHFASEVVVGAYNVRNPGGGARVFTVGSGTRDGDRKDAFYVNTLGDTYIEKNLYVNNKLVDVTALENVDNDLRQRITSIQDDVNKLEVDVTNVLSQIQDSKNDVDDLKKDIGDYNSFKKLVTEDWMMEIHQSIFEMTEEILILKENVTKLESQDNSSDLVAQVSNMVQTILAQPNNYTEQINLLQAQNVALKSELDNSKQAMATLETTLNEEVAALKAMIADISKPCVCEEKHGCRP